MPYISVPPARELHFFLTPVVLISRCEICTSLRLQETRRVLEELAVNMCLGNAGLRFRAA